MSKALVTFAVGGHRRLLALSLPGFERYAELHDYHLVQATPKILLRPPSWYKVPALLAALERHEQALWIDCDVLILDDELDLADEVPPDCWQALCRHHTGDGEVPNGGVWLVRRAMRPQLERLWLMDRYLNHGWWEQAALMELLGYQHAPAQLVEETELYRRTHWLGLEWNSHESADPHPQPRFAHATCGDLDWRVSVMRRRAGLAQLALTKGA